MGQSVFSFLKLVFTRTFRAVLMSDKEMDSHSSQLCLDRVASWTCRIYIVIYYLVLQMSYIFSAFGLPRCHEVEVLTRRG